ncbi:MAG: putative low-complexity protein [Parvicella sp.]|jgi:uncharacterized low-complexity protein
MKKNFKNVAFVLGMIAISTAAMTSCGAAENVKDAAADKAGEAGEVVKEKGNEVAPEATHDVIETSVDNVVEMVEGDSTAKCGEDKCGDDHVEDTTAKCGEEGAH